MTEKIGFIGLGLIGGSIARRIRDVFPSSYITAFDTNASSLSSARSDGVINEALSGFEASAFSDAGIIFICTPVSYAAQYLTLLDKALSPDTILTDVGSVKGEIFSEVEKYSLRDSFIGGHPMAGTEKSGYENSFSSLLEGASYVLTPSDSVCEAKIKRLEEFIGALGCHTLTLTPSRHDYAAAAISHLPHVLAYSLINLIHDAEESPVGIITDSTASHEVLSPDPGKNGTGDNAMHLMAAGGLKDMTRIASSSPDMWEQICLANRENIIDLMDDYIKMLSQIRLELDRSDGASLHERFAKGKKYRDTFK